ncbi:hypothetical protein CTRI78_v006104 [Colletotrichum trifolii]|uniref:Carcinoembryonic antigen-related cell adhesion molecule 1 n=1 Tax=Colletotrichum trifolii TaxID=5466 RepID=A0A4R8RG97_COLTR|nr:hypothetical protein CTRI78_v006104 [Colletotrichum trifolii]
MTPSKSQRLSRTAVILLLSNIFTISEASIFPRKTELPVLAFRTLDVRNWPLAATPAPWLGRRQEDLSTNTICGYIDADPNLPATCSAGSHCAMDASASAVGCCPNGAACTTGVYTGCVDQSSPTQTVSDPYVFTCQGSNVCYRNAFEGGAYQYGCGTTTVGDSVAATATGLSTTISITHVAGLVTRVQTSSSSTSGSSSSSSSTSGSSSSSSTTRSSSSRSSTTSSRSSTTSTARPTSTATPSPTPSAAPAGPPPGAAEGLRRNGAIIGGVIAGAAAFVGLVSLALWMRKRKRNQRMGPGPGKGPSYVGPVPGQQDFTPVPGQEMFDNAGYGHPSIMPGAHGTTTSISGGKAATNTSMSAFPARADEMPLNNHGEMEEFSRAYSDAVTHTDGSETRQGSAGGGSVAAGNGYSAGANPGGADAGGADITEERPLWQQNRRQSRNLMWM